MLVEHSFRAMGGPCRLRLEAADDTLVRSAVDAAVTEIARLERKYSRYTEDSLTSAINRAAGSGKSVAVDRETAGLLDYATTLWRESDGLFDLSSGILRRAWDFRSGRLPQQQEIDSLLPRVGWARVQWDGESVYLPARGMELDFGGLVKEYAADSAATAVRQAGIQTALVDLAGDMVSLGAPNQAAGWPVGIRHPQQRDTALARVNLPVGALASSGDYERCLVVEGRRYGHILNPHTGWPVAGLVAVSVLAPQCLVAGSSATVAMLKGAGEGIAWLEALGLPWLAVDAELHCHGTLASD